MDFTRIWGFYLEGGWLWRISGGFIKINLYNYLDYISIYYYYTSFECNQRRWVENPELLNLHKRLSIQSPVIANCRPIFPICQDLYTLGRGMFYKNEGRLWRLSFQGRKRKEVNKLPWKYYINNFILMNNSVSYPWIIHKWNITQIFLCNTIIYMFWI